MLARSKTRLLVIAGIAALLVAAFALLPAGRLQAATSTFDSPLPNPNPSCTGSYYTVVWGDTLYRISVRFGTTVSRLMVCNRIQNANRIWPGMRLLVPGTSTTPPPPSTTKWYRVVRGDTVSRIAARFGVSVTQIIRLNGLRYPYIIYVGQWLRIR